MTTTNDAALDSPLDVLFVAPHPDDVELFCGGFAALAASQGHRTGIVDLTEGELSSQGDIPTRRTEAAAAATALGVSWRHNLKLPDGSIGIEASNQLSLSEQLLRVVDLLRRTRPKILVVPYWHERHPDHGGASALLTRAAFLAALPRWAGADPSLLAHRIDQVLYYPMRVAAPVSFVVDTSPVIEQKWAALNCFSSQIVRSDSTVQTLVSSPLLRSSLEARDASFGALIGVSFGEGYIVKSPIPIGDPVSFFASASLHRALFFPEES